MTDNTQGSDRLSDSDNQSIKQQISCPKCKQSTGVRIVNTQTIVLPNKRMESASYCCLKCKAKWINEQTEEISLKKYYERKHGKA